MRISLLVYFIFLSILSVFSQDGDLNMKIVAHVPAPEGGSGIWHYVDRNGVEYAAIGTQTALVVYSLEDPSKPIERYRASGVRTIWREVFFYKDYIYGVTDNASDGVIIINMKEAPNKISHKFWTTSITANNQTANITTCHTVFVDEKGILSLNGCRPWQGVLFFDLNQDPENPVFLGAETKRYCHDNFVRNDTMFSSDILDGLLSIWNVKDPLNPKELTTITTPFAFTHNSWPSDDRKYVFTTDERENAYVAAYDISDLTNIKLVDQWRPKDTEGKGVIPHNTRYLNGYLITSYYTDGVKIVDANRPENLIEVGSVDTYFGNQSGFHGCWGVSPYLPSGTIVASDIEGGLFVIQADYIRACYLEGLVTDSLTNETLSNVSVIIQAARKNEELTNLKGLYKTGYATAGLYDVTYMHPDYLPQTVQVSLQNGIVTIRNIKLVKKETILQRIIVKDKNTLQEIEGAQIAVFNQNKSIQVTTNAQGESTVGVPTDLIPYQVVAGKWGYLHQGTLLNPQPPAKDITLLLEKGYQDDFIFEFNWTVQTTASSGAWIRAEPLGSLRNNLPVQTEHDVPTDFGVNCYVTGNGSSDPSGDDIDGGITRLTSPVMDLSQYNDPLLNVQYWFTNGGGSGNPNDSLSFYLIHQSNGVFDTVLIRTIRRNDPNWNKIEKLKIKTFINNPTFVQLLVEAGDYDPGHLVEAAVDAFLIEEGQIVANYEVDNQSILSAHPNPFTDQFILRWENKSSEDIQLLVYSIDGQLIELKSVTPQQHSTLLGNTWKSGVYLIQFIQGKHKEQIKVVKH